MIRSPKFGAIAIICGNPKGPVYQNTVDAIPGQPRLKMRIVQGDISLVLTDDDLFEALNVPHDTRQEILELAHTAPKPSESKTQKTAFRLNALGSGISGQDLKSRFISYIQRRQVQFQGKDIRGQDIMLYQ